MMKYKVLTLAVVAMPLAVSGRAQANPFELDNQKIVTLQLIDNRKEPPQEKPKQDTQTVYTVKKNDSLSKIAKHHKTSAQRLYDRNLDIKDPDVISVGQKIVVPDKNEKLKHRAIVVEATPYPRQRSVGISNSAPRGSGVNGFEWGWCTWYAQSQRMDKKFRGNAKDWMAFVNGYTPKVGAVAVNTNAAGGYGHVAIVIGIKGSQIKVRHMNWAGFGVVTEDWIDKSYWSGYIL